MNASGRLRERRKKAIATFAVAAWAFAKNKKPPDVPAAFRSWEDCRGWDHGPESLPPERQWY